MTLLEIVEAAAKRFDSRPIYRASIEARKELTMDAPSQAIKAIANQCDFTKEVTALQKIADVLEGRSNEEACAIMAAVSSILGFYDQARAFNECAANYRAAAMSDPDRTV